MSVLPWLYGITEFKELFLRKWLCGFQELLYLGNFGEVERIVPVRKDSLQDLGRKFLGGGDHVHQEGLPAKVLGAMIPGHLTKLSPLRKGGKVSTRAKSGGRDLLELLLVVGTSPGLLSAVSLVAVVIMVAELEVRARNHHLVRPVGLFVQFIETKLGMFGPRVHGSRLPTNATLLLQHSLLLLAWLLLHNKFADLFEPTFNVFLGLRFLPLQSFQIGLHTNNFPLYFFQSGNFLPGSVRKVNFLLEKLGKELLVFLFVPLRASHLLIVHLFLLDLSDNFQSACLAAVLGLGPSVFPAHLVSARNPSLKIIIYNNRKKT